MIIAESVEGMPRYQVVETLKSVQEVVNAEYTYGVLSGATRARTARAAEEVFELDYELEVVDQESLLPGTYVLLWEDNMGREGFKVLELL